MQQRMPLIAHEIKTDTAPNAQNKQGINKTNTLKEKQQNDADNSPLIIVVTGVGQVLLDKMALLAWLSLFHPCLYIWHLHLQRFIGR